MMHSDHLRDIRLRKMSDLDQLICWAHLPNEITSPIFPNQMFGINAIIWHVGVVWGEECFLPVKSQAFLFSDCGRHFDGRKNSLIPSCCCWYSSSWHQHPWTLYLMPATLSSKPQGAWYTKRKECTTKYKMLLEAGIRLLSSFQLGLWRMMSISFELEVLKLHDTRAKKLIISSWTPHASITLGDKQRKQRDHLPVYLTVSACWTQCDKKHKELSFVIKLLLYKLQ